MFRCKLDDSPKLEQILQLTKSSPKATLIHKKINLIEMLIVLAILVILLSLLLPAIKGAVEKSRRVSCMSNIKQHYSMWTVYADDFHDLIPYGGTGDVSMYYPLSFSGILWDGYDSVYQYYSEYIGLKFTWNRQYLMKAKTVAQCPSGLANSLYEANHYFTSPLARPGYAVLGLGVLNPNTGAGQPRLSKMANGGPKGPVIFMVDTMSNYLVDANSYYKNMNHAEQGGNVCMANGSVTWYDIEYFGPYGMPSGINAYYQYPQWNDPAFNTTFFKGAGQGNQVRKSVYGYHK